MKMKIQKLSLILISMILLTSCSSNVNTVNSEGIYSNTSDTAVQSAPSQIVNKDTLSQTVNDIKVEITSAKVVDIGVEIGVCYATPDGGDWYPTPGHLFYGIYDIYPDQYGFITEEKANGNKQGKRCVLVYYRIDDLETIASPIEFSIDDFEARPLEMFSACQNFQERLDTSPKAKAYGLRAICTENSDGSFSIVLNDHANSVAKENANKALDEIAKGIVTGPWIFTINEIER